MKSKMTKKLKVLEFEDELKTCQKRLDGFGKDLKFLLTQINVISDWIIERFGVHLTDRTSYFSKNTHIIDNANELTESVFSANTQNLKGINITASSASTDVKYTSSYTEEDCEDCSTAVENNEVDISSQDFIGDDYLEGNTNANCLTKRGRQKVSPRLSPTAHITDGKQGATAKRGRPKKQSSDTADDTSSKCDTCGKLLKDSGSLRQHMLIHKNLKPYPCPECGKCFRRKFHLKTHSLIHAGVKKHQCRYCGRLFLLPKDLIIHERVHTGEKPFSCNTCPKSFNLKSHLVMHIRTHTGEKPYKCEVCQKCFSQSNSLRVHKKVHQKLRNPPTKRSATQQQRRSMKQRISSPREVYIIPNEVPQSRPGHQQSSNMEVTSLLSSSQSSINSSSVNIPNLVTFDILPMAVSLSQHQHEDRRSSQNTAHENIKIEPSNLTVQEVLQLQSGISETVEIINLSHVNIEQIIGHESVENANRQNQVINTDNIENSAHNFIGSNVTESYFY